MQWTVTTDQFQEKSGKSQHRQSAVPDLRTVVPSPFPLLLGIELDSGGQFSGLVEIHLRTRKAVRHHVSQAFDEGGIGVESTDTTEVDDPCFSSLLPVFDIDLFESFNVLAHEADRNGNQITGFRLTKRL